MLWRKPTVLKFTLSGWMLQCELHAFASLFYILSLEGGTLEYIKLVLSRLGVALIASVVCFLTLFVRAVLYQPRQQACASVFFIALNVLLLYFLDHGENFASHGMYNFLLFMVFFLPSATLITGCFYFRRKFPKPFKFIGTVTLITLSIYIFFGLQSARADWHRGISSTVQSEIPFTDADGTKMSVNLCPLDPNWPIFDLFPNRMLNFWASSFYCTKNSNFWYSNLDSDGTLTISGCPPEKFPKFLALPDTRGWVDEKQTIQYTLRPFYLNFSRYTGPINLKGVEQVITQCGKEQRVNIQIERRKPFNPVPDIAKPGTPQEPNILFLFMDALSRTRFKRKFTNTVNFLSDLHFKQDKKFYDFFRYFLSGFNTIENTMALYTGSSEYTNFSYPIFKNFTDSGWATMWATSDCEDWMKAVLGNILPHAFTHESVSSMCNPIYYLSAPGEFALGTLHGPYSIKTRCLYGDYVHNVPLTYVEKFIETYHKKQRFFAVLSLIEGHEGTGDVLLTVDKNMENFLRKIVEKDVLKDTIVFLIGDHGPHMGLNVMYTQNGKMDHMSPMLGILAPPETGLDEAFSWNKNMIFSGQDIYKFIASWLETGEKAGKGGIGSKLSPNRQCADIKTPDELCPCKQVTTKQI